MAQLLASNPKADVAAVQEGLRLVEKLRECGFSGQKYDLASPYGATVHTSDEGEWRTAGV